MEIDDGRSRAGRDKILSLRPNPDDSPLPAVDPETQRNFNNFSPEAKSATRRLMGTHLDKLIETSIVMKDTVEGDQVSEANVNAAGHLLNKKEESGALRKLSGIIGGIFLGTGVTGLISILQAGKFDRNGTIIMAVSSVLGAFLIAADLPGSILPKWKKRGSSEPAQPLRVRRRSMPPSPKAPKT